MEGLVRGVVVSPEFTVDPALSSPVVTFEFSSGVMVFFPGGCFVGVVCLGEAVYVWPFRSACKDKRSLTI